MMLGLQMRLVVKLVFSHKTCGGLYSLSTKIDLHIVYTCLTNNIPNERSTIIGISYAYINTRTVLMRFNNTATIFIKNNSEIQEKYHSRGIETLELR
jgi:hypothetical protein